MTARQAIPALVADWVEKTRQRDIEGCVAFFAEDGAFMAPNAPEARGHAAIRAAWAAMFAQPNLVMTFGPTFVDEAASGDLAYEVGTWSIGYDTPAGRFVDHGKYVVVWRHIAGAWKALADIFNSNVPRPEE
jgi:ketosteroid isomerase-like protein